MIPAGSSCHLYSPSDWAYHAKVRLRIHLNGEVTAVQISGATSVLLGKPAITIINNEFLSFASEITDKVQLEEFSLSTVKKSINKFESEGTLMIEKSRNKMGLSRPVFEI